MPAITAHPPARWRRALLVGASLLATGALAVPALIASDDTTPSTTAEAAKSLDFALA